ncbi:AAA domain-containing protein [Ruminococcus sp. YRD2003]|uniref:AAA domain-containing protein n=1 Tax=Ruminococcus sp. YRD2003 TaxID=1452313 RepID=UPI00115F7AFF
MENDDTFSFVNMKDDIIIYFEMADRYEGSIIRDFLFRGYWCIAMIKSILKNNDEITSAYFHTVAFYNKDYYPKMQIVLSEKVNEQLNNKKIKIEDFSDSFRLSDGTCDTLLAYTNGDYNLEMLNMDKPDNEDLQDIDKFEDLEINQLLKEKSSSQRIKLYGSNSRAGNLTLYVKIIEKENGMLMVADKLVFGSANIPCMKLAKSEIDFTDEAGYISEKTKQLFKESNDGYIAIWEAYSALEGELLIKRAKKIGVLTFSDVTIKENHTVLTLSEECRDSINELKKGDIINFNDDFPAYITDKTMDWKTYRELLSTKSGEFKEKKNDSFEIVGLNTRSGLIKIDGTKNELVRTAFLSIGSDLIQIIRRENSRNIIKKGESANPKLGMLIEGVADERVLSFSNSNVTKHPALTEMVKNKLFPKHLPTENQKKAIEIAINTPDIAMILGPPGTGKTTVINAIVERLNEIDNKSVNNRGKVLISSTQHDAVTNIIERMSINGLPTPKFGKKSGDEEYYDNISKWCENIKKSLAEKYSFIQGIEQRNQLEQYFNMYIKTVSDATKEVFLKYAKTISSDPLQLQEINTILQEMSEGYDTVQKDDDLLRSIRGIRTKKSSFFDDGALRARELYYKLNDIHGFKNVHPEMLKVLREAAMTAADGMTPELSEKLKKIKDELLLLYLPKPVVKREQIDERIIELYHNLKAWNVSVENEEQDIILSLYNELDNNIALVQEQMSAYSYAFSSTLQQSVSKKVRYAKLGKDNKTYGASNNRISYDTVIIDEAARATPGDLLIPLSQASKRIILVGDPHQLTHIYNEDILNAIGEDDECSRLETENIKKSMFSYLWEKVAKLEEKDNIKRRIVLNQQFRTHALLGNFVSDNFYKPYGEEYSSPLSDELFKQEIYDSPVRWIDMPLSAGEMKGGTTYSRECEADYIVNKLIEYKFSEKGKGLSFGVITFYRGQTNLLKRKMQEKYPDYEHDGVRIGSVDAFQGMEFDVIFLSVVRTGVKTFGFLTSVNRLCVAMSRQKKLLIIVGDSEMFSSPKAEKEIPSLKHLLEMCRRKGWEEKYASDQ